ncbi:MAG: FtsQ-type POTRA domain-containing protein [Patescibacteria group bacterium]|nr:FtsQ-type POTRA domain-containing protein [Patescibacteria group bacterium]
MPFFRKKEKNKSWKGRNPKVYSGVPRRDNQEKRGRFSRFLFWVLFLGFLGVCGYMLLFSPFLEIESVGVEGNQDIPAEEIIGKVNETLGGKYFNFLSKRNFFLASRRAISEKLKNDFSRLEISSIEKKFPRAILIRVKERQPEMAWCSAGVCYLADKDGFIYTGANATDEELNKDRFLIAIDDNARPVEVRKTIIDPDFIQYMKQADAILVDDLGLQVDGNYHTPALSSQEVVVRINEGEGWTLKLSRTIPPEETKKIIQTVFDKELDGEKRKLLDYLDLRIRGKVYYKLK